MTTESRAPLSIDALVDSLSLAEQVALLAGSDFWHTVAIPSAGIPAMRVTDGPVGARGTEFDGPASMNVPCGTALASTWDPDLARQVGELLGRETRAKGARLLLAPTVNLHRTPVGGRNFECFSEDPLLTSDLAVAYVEGVQSEGVGCCIKHFVGNDTEFERNSIDSRIDERTLRELYLRPFEAAVTEADVVSVMTSYNRINGPFAADSAELVDGVLRREWGFDGLVVSDWFGLHSTVEGVEAGLDLEMPGPTLHRGAALVEAVEAGTCSREAVRTAARNVLAALLRLGVFDDGGPGPETTRHDADDLALIRRAAAAGTVLVRNAPDGNGVPVLPLSTTGFARVAVVGPNAEVGQIMGGGSAHVTPTSVSHPLDALRAHFEASGIQVVSARGAVTHKRLPPFPAEYCSPVELEFFADPDAFDHPPVEASRSATTRTTHFMWTTDPIEPDAATHQFAVRVRFTFTPPSAGAWTVSLNSIAAATLSLDGHTVLDNADAPVGGSFFGMGKDDIQTEVMLEAGHPYEFVAEMRRPRTQNALSGLQLGAFEPIEADPLAAAVAAATDADLTVVVVGTNDDWESEGWDRATLELPGEQDRLVTEVARVSRRTVVVVNAGSPVLMPWLDAVDAVLVCWFPGQEMGNALVDVLSGAVEPGGRLPVTFPARLEDTPAFEHHPGRNGVANYLEGRLIGYRWYDTVGREPLLPFGFGLGYAPVTIESAAWRDERRVTVVLHNGGTRDGAQVVQTYLRHTTPTEGDEPIQQLVGFARLEVPAGARATVVIELDDRVAMTWSVEDHAWVAADGPFELVVGTSSRDVARRLPFPAV